jgi:transcriptional regulator with XRE-family HTH domain
MDRTPAEAHDAPMALGRAVAAAMHGWTQKALAEASGIPQGRISAIVNNYRGERVSMDEAVRIEAAVGLPRGFILGYAGIVTAAGAKRGAEAAARAARAGGSRSAPPT